MTIGGNYGEFMIDKPANVLTSLASSHVAHSGSPGGTNVLKKWTG